MASINRVILNGNLTRDPDLKELPSGTSVGNMRLAVNTRRKVDGEWVDQPNYFDITVWGKQAENCFRYLAKGRPVLIDGRLEWREYQDKDGNNRQAVQVVAEQVVFLGGREDRDETPAGGAGVAPSEEIPFGPSVI